MKSSLTKPLDVSELFHLIQKDQMTSKLKTGSEDKLEILMTIILALKDQVFMKMKVTKFEKGTLFKLLGDRLLYMFISKIKI